MRLDWDRIFAVLLLVLMVVFVGCGEDEPEISSVEDLKDTDAKNIIWKRDGAEMVLIPAGSFEMGDHLGNMDHRNPNTPVHTVELDAFYMDVNEVTVGRFKRFVEDSGYDYQEQWAYVANYSLGDGYPMVCVTWNDATAYAKWAGKRLSTEAEWEYAARGGLAGKLYPWGDDDAVARDYANYSGTGGKDQWDNTTAPVGSLKSNGYGLYDMMGNVFEWCSDWYNADYYTQSPSSNPQGPEPSSGEDARVVRGGSWLSTPSGLRAANRGLSAPSNAKFNIGFRCVSGFPAAKQ